MYKRCQVVMLPTKEKATIVKYPNGTLVPTITPEYFYSIGKEGQNLYILSDDKIEVGDYCLTTTDYSSVSEVKDSRRLNDIKQGLRSGTFHKKVIASTDTSLGLPSPSPEFLQVYCEKQPEEVLVKYIGNLSPITNDFDGTSKLIVTNNQIFIKKIQQMYSREQVIEIIEEVMSQATSCEYFDHPESYL